ASAIAGNAAKPTPAPGIFDQLRPRNLGPQVSGGRLGAVAGTDSDSSLYYAGAAGGGVWKTTNAAQSWEPVFEKQHVQSIGALTIDPSNENVVWVGTGEGAPRNDVIPGDGVYRTSDGGKTWQHVLTLRNALVAKIEVDPRDVNTVLVGVLGDPFADSSDRGMYRTTDGGKTWKKTLYVDARAGVSDMDVSRKDPAVVFAGMWAYRRTGWSSQSGGTQGGLYKSTDFGATWQRLTGGGLPEGPTGRIGIAIAPSNDQRIYALIESSHGLLWRSDDGGTNWKMVSDNTLIDERPFYYTHVFVDPTNQNHLWTLSVHVAVSSDGGKNWKIGARGVHGDNHGMWISQDAKRIIEANDGGPSFSFDDGASWQMPHNLPIAQLYHIGFDRERPYHICAPLQDNGVWCAPNDALDGGAITSSNWNAMGGGDGTWAVPDPANSRYVWLTSGGGNFAGEMEVLDRATNTTRVISPYLRDQNAVDPKDLRYRFNWETPIAFDPFDPHVAYTAGNVVFSSSDRGYHWKQISGDLTRNEKAHQVVTGGITLDGTGAETSDTILYIAPSPVRRGEIWTGTDDGVIALTLDGGKHWRRVTPPLTNVWGRFASLSASKHDAGTLYAAYDLHMTGDRAPHIYLTHDYGAHWRDIASGLPREDEVRSIRQDPKNPRVLYAGLEQGLWMSFDGGSHWRDMKLIPPTSVRDVRVQPDANDLLIATHGRGVYVLDDLTPLQRYPVARAQIFPVRTAYQWNLHRYYATHVDGAGPPYGAIVTYYLPRAQKNVHAEVVDAAGRVIRRFDAKAAGGGQAGYNRFTWDTTGQPPVSWNFTPKWNQTFESGAPVLPGRYTVRVHAGSQTLRARLVVKQDPRTHYTLAQLVRNHDAAAQLLADFSRVNTALNELSTIVAEAPLRLKALETSKNGALSLRVADAASKAKMLLLSITQNPVNDQDDDFLTDILRERLQTQIETFNSLTPPTQAQLQENEALHALTAERLREAAQFEGGDLRSVNDALRGVKLPPLTTLTHKPQVYNPNI
ncbi:MAG TPA: hypothetical protein VFN37_12565, partial [Candidatus Baltobacteraceae bacterium]|nr:hypothetical protein [Candidatus Baltobacteraceae bacterium]